MSNSNDLNKYKENKISEALKEFKKKIKENPITVEEAKLALYAIDNELSVRINDVIIKDNSVGHCHWRCSSRGHGPLPQITAKEMRDLILNPLINPGNNND